MKKKPIFHPKLYFKYELQNNEVTLFYYSNKFDDSGNRLIQTDVLKSDFFSEKEIYKLNKKQYHNLNIYIERQERIIKTYLKKGFTDQCEIVRVSVNLMYQYKKEFDNWFSNYIKTFKIGINS